MSVHFLLHIFLVMGVLTVSHFCDEQGQNQTAAAVLGHVSGCRKSSMNLSRGPGGQGGALLLSCTVQASREVIKRQLLLPCHVGTGVQHAQLTVRSGSSSSRSQSIASYLCCDWDLVA